MDVRNCRNCGRLFNYFSGPNICPACKEEAEKKFVDVRDFIRDNPHATMQEVADENEVSTNQIRQWIREERLQFASDSPIGIECEKCGAIIKTGRFCENCKNTMASLLESSIAKPKYEDPAPQKQNLNDRMYFQRK